jgi:hypothetical protein
MSSAIAQPDPGIALNPPVPQPQLMKQFPSGVFEMMGDRSPVMSTIPPHCRNILRRLSRGKKMLEPIFAEIFTPFIFNK